MATPNNSRLALVSSKPVSIESVLHALSEKQMASVIQLTTAVISGNTEKISCLREELNQLNITDFALAAIDNSLSLEWQNTAGGLS